MRNTLPDFWVLMGFFLCFFPVMTHAANRQTIVVGSDFVSPVFIDSDLAGVTGLYSGSEFVEWNFSDNFALGVRSHKAYKSASGIDLIIVDLNASLTWFFMETRGNLSFAVYAGYGPGYIIYTDTGNSIDIPEATGNASSYGLIMDWGGRRWGLRLNYHNVSAIYDYNDGAPATIDGSNSGLGLGFRFAF